MIIEYAKKLPTNTRDKLLRKIDDAFRQAIEINKETSFVEAATGRDSDHNNTRIETQINELEDSFQEYDINVMSTRSTNRSETDPGTVLLTGHHKETTRSIHHKLLDQITEVTVTPTMKIHKINKASTETTAEIEGISNNQDTNRENRTTRTGMRTTKIETGLTTGEDQTNTNIIDNQHEAQVIFEFSDQNMMEMMQTVRGFINLIKANPTTREHYKSNKLASWKYKNEVNKSEIKSSSLEQVQQFFNKDTDLVFDALVAADYIDEIDCADVVRQSSA